MITLLISKLTSFGAFDIGPCTPSQTAHSFFGFPHWWKYLPHGHKDALNNCVPDVTFPGGIWPIALAIIDMLLYLAGLVAVVSIIIAGITYVTALGNPEKNVAARRRLVNSLIGLAIVLIAIEVVSFIGNKLG
jgi:hypothetical protein